MNVHPDDIFLLAVVGGFFGIMLLLALPKLIGDAKKVGHDVAAFWHRHHDMA